MIPFLVFAYHWRMWTFVLSVVAAIAFTIMQRKGYSFANLLRRLSVMMAGTHRPAQTDRKIRSDI